MFFVTFSTYLLFLLAYSVYLANIFYRHESSRRRRIKISELILVTSGGASGGGGLAGTEAAGRTETSRVFFPDSSNIEVLEEEPEAEFKNYTR